MAVKPLHRKSGRARTRATFCLRGLWLSLGIVCGCLLPRTAGENIAYEQHLRSPLFKDAALEDGLDERPLPAPNGMPVLSNPPELPKPSGEVLALLEDTLLVSAIDGKVYALETATGKLLWTFRTGAPLVSVSNIAAPKDSPSKERDDGSGEGAGSEDNIEAMFPGLDGSLYRLDSGGWQLFTPSVKEVESLAPSVADDGGLVVGSHRASLFVVDPYTGQMLHKYAHGTEGAENSTLEKMEASTAPDTVGETIDEAEAAAGGGADVGLSGGGSAGVAVRKPPVYIVRKDYTVTKHGAYGHDMQWNASFGEVTAIGLGPAQRGWENVWENAAKISEQKVGQHYMLEVRLKSGASWRRLFPTPSTAVFSPRGYRVKNLMPSIPKDLMRQPHTVGLINVGNQGVMMRIINRPGLLPKQGSQQFDYTHLDLVPRETLDDPKALVSVPPEPTLIAIPESKGDPLYCPTSDVDLAEGERRGGRERENEHAVRAVRRKKDMWWASSRTALPGGQLDKRSVPAASWNTDVETGDAPGPESSPEPSFSLQDGLWWMFGLVSPAFVSVVGAIVAAFVAVRKWLGWGGGTAASSPKSGKKKKKRGGKGQNSSADGSEPELQVVCGIPPGGLTVGKIEVSPKVLGHGSAGTVVFEGRYMGRRAAVKRVLRTHQSRVDNEVENTVLSDAHECVVRCFDVEKTDDFSWLALEFCDCNLFELVSALTPAAEFRESVKVDIDLDELPSLWDAKGLPTETLHQLFTDMVNGVVHLHKLKIVHRDLKPQNILVSRNHDGKLRAKLSDMGISRSNVLDVFHNTNGAALTGSAGYKAPEQLKKNQVQTPAVDMFALGCVLYFCVSGGKHPFAKDAVHRDSNIARGLLADMFPLVHFPEACHLISHLLDFDPYKRYTALQAKHHPMLWSSERRLQFLMECSDRIEGKEAGTDELIEALEEVRMTAMGGEWGKAVMTREFKESLTSHRSYNTTSLRHLLRVIRNKYHHFRELADDFQRFLGNSPEGFDSFFREKFPDMLMEVYKVFARRCSHEPAFKKYFDP